MSVVIIDSHDSFVGNLVAGFEALGARVSVLQSDSVTVPKILEESPARVVLGAGPGRPEESGQLVQVARQLCGLVPLLGVCLGHQAIALAHGGRIIRHQVAHGRASEIRHTQQGLFDGLPPDVKMTRYHSLVIDPESLPDGFRVTAWSKDGAIMAMAHHEHPTVSVQFHPESVLSGSPGMRLLHNFMQIKAVHSLKPYPSPELIA